MKKHGRSLAIRAINSSFVTIIPIIMIGAFTLVAISFPVPIYQTLINSAFGGGLREMLLMVYSATFGMLSIYVAASVGINYVREQKGDGRFDFAPPLLSLLCFFIMVGVFEADFSVAMLGAQGIFTALVSSIGACAIYFKIKSRIGAATSYYAEGLDIKFTNAVSAIVPMLLVCGVFALFAKLITIFTGAGNFNELFISSTNALFANMGRSFFSGLLFVTTSSLLWFLGIHGSNCLDGVAQSLFVPATQINIDAVAMGLAPTEILTKSFFDTFVLMGGCGATLCLLASLLLFSKRRSSRHISHLSALPMIFNINEAMVFGLPIVFNWALLVPFVLTPIACYITSYLAFSTGLVPLIAAPAEWTTPVAISGFVSTGSFSGTLLQIFNLGMGMLIYMPFIKYLDAQKLKDATDDYQSLVGTLQEHQAINRDVVLTQLENVCGGAAKSLVLDLQAAMTKKHLTLFYQPQYDYNGICVGVEALLRWKHELFGYVYPPLIIALAEESGMLAQLEEEICLMAFSDIDKIKQAMGENIRVSINVTGVTIMSQRFMDFLNAQNKKGVFKNTDIFLEVTEQMALAFDQKLFDIFSKIKSMGVSLAIDDFSMGHTSIEYLKDSFFNEIKLDGSLVKGVLENKRYRDIIAYIVQMATSLDLHTVAEYVETREQCDALAQIGCQYFQGYLFSPAVPLEKLSSIPIIGDKK